MFNRLTFGEIALTNEILSDALKAILRIRV